MNFDQIFEAALDAGLTVAKSGGKAAQNWLRQVAAANRETLLAIATGTLQGEISKDTAVMLLEENARTLRSEAAALTVIIRAAAQGAINAFLNRLFQGLGAALKLAI